jgi:hypothetical protein
MTVRACISDGISKGVHKAFGGVLAAVALLVCFATNVYADNSLSCYKGDKDNRIYIGEISGADFQNAAAECNSFFGDCNGECYGCYLDEESTREICLDSQGNKFTR